MSKFKVGDKVRLVRPVNDCVSKALEKVNPLTICRINNGSLYFFGQPTRDSYSPEQFDLVASAARTELEELVEKANAGYAAREKIIEKYYDQVDFHRAWRLVEKSSRVGKITVKPKPKFESFTTSNGWKVELIENILIIGCKQFEVNSLKTALHSMIVNNVTDAFVEDMNPNYALGTRRRFSAGYKGITTDESHLLLWVDAENIYAKLKELGK